MLPEVPWERRRRLQAEWSLTDEELRDLVNAGALDLIEARSRRVRLRVRPDPGGWRT